MRYLLNNLLIIVLTFIFLYFVSNVLYCQKYDYTWLWGYDSSDNMLDTVYGTTVMDFNTTDLTPKIYYDGKEDC